MNSNAENHKRRKRGFERTARLVSARVRSAAESRGFGVTRLLTRWEEVVGPEMARMTRPVEMSYARDGFGATLTLLTTGANAPMVDMRRDSLREKINAVYGYAAVSRIRITQTAPTGFAEGQAQFRRPKPSETPKPDPEELNAVHQSTQSIANTDLRNALDALGANILARNAKKQAVK